MKRLKRRTLLRGAMGTAIALPVLEAMLHDNGVAQADGTQVAPRFLLAFGGFSVGQDDKPGQIDYVPSATGSAYPVTTCLAPLAARGVTNQVSIVSGLNIPAWSGSGPMPPGGRTSFHWHCNPLIAGRAQLNQTAVDVSVTGPSADRVMAQSIGQGTTFSSLNYRAQAQFYFSNPGGIDVPHNRDTLSFDDNGQGLPPTVSPRIAYNALFAGFAPADPAEAAAKALALDKRRSVLDVVDRRMAGVVAKLSAADQRRIDEHLTQIRELELRLDAAPPDIGGACALLPDPGADPPLGTPTTDDYQYQSNASYSGEQRRVELLADLIHMAFVCDLTRVATLMITYWQSFMNVEPVTGFTSYAHLVNHGDAPAPAPLAELEKICSWHVDQFGYLVEKLANTPEGACTALDNCALVFLNEGGHGSNGTIAYSSHSTENMVALIAGGAGGLVPGQHIVAPAGANHPVNVTLSAMQAAGYQGNRHGDITGRIDGLFV